MFFSICFLFSFLFSIGNADNSPEPIVLQKIKALHNCVYTHAASYARKTNENPTDIAEAAISKCIVESEALKAAVIKDYIETGHGLNEHADKAAEDTINSNIESLSKSVKMIVLDIRSKNR